MSVKFLNRARKTSNGSFVFWYTLDAADPSMSASNAPSPSSDFSAVVTVGKTLTGENLFKEDLTNQVGSGNVTTFVTSKSYVAGSLRVFWNGQYQRLNDTFTETGATTFSTTFSPGDGSAMQVEYRPA
jgi:hypothetical protein